MNRLFRKGFIFLFTIGLFLCCHMLFAWPIENGVDICTVAGSQNEPRLISDGVGGAIITWYDNRNGTDYVVYAQRVNSSGSTLWTLDGVANCTASNYQVVPKLATDGEGGAIITWYDSRDGNYAQRVDSNGSTLWTLDGVSLCTAANVQSYPSITSDEFGGAIIAWVDGRNNGDFDIYAQRVNSNGSTLWTLDGVAICTASFLQQFPTIISDGAGGAIITWEDTRTEVIDGDIYVQRVNSAGSTLWTLEGVAICTGLGYQTTPTLVSDGTGGAVITWFDYRSGGVNSDIYAQRVNSSGSTLWTLNGVAICTMANRQEYPNIVSDGGGGAIITWEDQRSFSSNYNIYAQRVNSSGSTLWIANGEAICTVANIQQSPTIVSDSAGGAIITWQDLRSGNYNIYAQDVNSNGSTLWTLNGVAICTAVNIQELPTIVSNGAGGAIIAWQDTRNGSNYDIYAQSINISGVVPIVLSDFSAMEGIKE